VGELLLRVAKSRSSWRVGVARHLLRPIAAERLLLKVQRSVASQDYEWQVSAAAVIGLQNLTGCSQPNSDSWSS
jgi:hypothetical protein